MYQKITTLTIIALIGLLVAACGGQQEVKDVTLMLDWTPNTNHTGLYVAQSEGYFEEAGLNVSIIEPGENFVESAVAAGAANFGISFQEVATFAMAEDAPIVSVAAIIQHNTSGFAARSEQNVNSAADLAGKRYGAFGSPIEQPILNLLMECAGESVDTVEFIDIGWADFLSVTEADEVDFAWIFYGWSGIGAEQSGVELDIVMLKDHTDCVPDYYTPILITSQEQIEADPDMVKAFVGAVAKGYEYAIDNPDSAADILLAAAPELDENLVKASQAWLANEYQADASQWGIQDRAIWQNFGDFLIASEVLEGPFDADAAFTNEFLD